ncbi:hypothetical protein NWF32_13360 [Pseudomonas qingdaonensis]|nr:hypothetical protein [Pseudomonas qingdaonensis]
MHDALAPAAARAAGHAGQRAAGGDAGDLPGLSLRAWALEVHAQLGIYPALIALQCVLLEQCFERHRGVAQGLLVVIGLCTVHLLLGLCRELLGSAGLRLAQLTPGALILLGLLLAIFNRVRRKPAPLAVKGSL